MSQQATQEARDLQLATAECQIDLEQRDVWACTWGAQIFIVQIYNVTADQAFRWIWKSRCTMKLRVFVWLLLSDRLKHQEHAQT